MLASSFTPLRRYPPADSTSVEFCVRPPGPIEFCGACINHPLSSTHLKNKTFDLYLTKIVHYTPCRTSVEQNFTAGGHEQNPRGPSIPGLDAEHRPLPPNARLLHPLDASVFPLVGKRGLLITTDLFFQFRLAADFSAPGIAKFLIQCMNVAVFMTSSDAVFSGLNNLVYISVMRMLYVVTCKKCFRCR